MNTMKPDNVSILIQSCDSGLTAFITRSASPTCCFRPFGDLVTFNMLNIHVVTTINYHRVSHSRFFEYVEDTQNRRYQLRQSFPFAFW